MAIAAALSVRQTSSRAAYYAALISATSLLSYFSSQLSSVHTLYSALVSFCMAAFAYLQRKSAALHSRAYFVRPGFYSIRPGWYHSAVDLPCFLYSILIDDLTIFRKAFLNVFGLSFSVSVSLGYILFLYFKNPALLAFYATFHPPLPLFPVFSFNGGLFPGSATL